MNGFLMGPGVLDYLCPVCMPHGGGDLCDRHLAEANATVEADEHETNPGIGA